MTSPIMRVPRRRYEARQQETTTKRALGWMLFLSSAFWPRAGIIAFWIFGNQLSHAFSSWVIPCLGFFLLPWTTVTYAILWGVDNNRALGWWWILVGCALVLDIITWAGGRHLAKS